MKNLVLVVSGEPNAETEIRYEPPKLHFSR